MTKSGRIISALALGGILGMLVALRVPQIVWWLSVLAASLIAGFAYALPDIVRHTPTASRTAWRSLARLPGVVRTIGRIIATIAGASLFAIGLRPKMHASQRLMVVIVWLSIALWVTSFYFLATDNGHTLDVRASMFLILIYEIYLAALFIWASGGVTFRSQTSPTNESKMAIRKKALFYVTPPGTIFLVGRSLVRIAPFMARIGWDLGKFVVRFTKTLFILVHSKELALVSIDTALGVAITYLLYVRQGNPVLGVGPTLVLSGLISVLVGYFLDYQIVSRRFLRINKKRPN